MPPSPASGQRKGARGRPKGSPNQVTKTLREVFQHLGTLHAHLIESTITRELRNHGAHAPEYVRLIAQYQLGRPPEQGEQARPQPMQFFFLTGAPGPGGRDPIAEMRTIDAEPLSVRPALAAGVVPPPEPVGETFERLE